MIYVTTTRSKNIIKMLMVDNYLQSKTAKQLKKDDDADLGTSYGTEKNMLHSWDSVLTWRKKTNTKISNQFIKKGMRILKNIKYLFISLFYKREKWVRINNLLVNVAKNNSLSYVNIMMSLLWITWEGTLNHQSLWNNISLLQSL